LTFIPGVRLPTCPLDATMTSLVGSTIFQYKCQNGHQFYVDPNGNFVFPNAVVLPASYLAADPLGDLGVPEGTLI